MWLQHPPLATSRTFLLYLAACSWAGQPCNGCASTDKSDTGMCCMRMQPRMTMARTLKLYKLPDAPVTPGLRPMTAADVPQVHG